MKERKALVIRSPGTNCDDEMYNALTLVGFKTDKMHLNELFANKKKLHDYSLLAISGGFSYGDYLGSGKVFANKLKFKLKTELNKFIREENIDSIRGGLILMNTTPEYSSGGYSLILPKCLSNEIIILFSDLACFAISTTRERSS